LAAIRGKKNFAVEAVDSVLNAAPQLVEAELYHLQQEGLKTKH